MSLLDKAIEALSPSWAASRAESRARIERASALQRGFNAATKGRRLGDGWKAIGADSSPTPSASDVALIRERAREMARNNPYWLACRRAVVSQVVGHGIRATIVGPNKRVSSQVQADFELWAASRSADAAGRLDWYAIQALVMSTVVQSGECLVRRVLTENGLKLQVLGPEYLCSDNDTADGKVMGGVEVDPYGAPIAYHLYRVHPSLGSGEKIRVLAGEICHVFRVDEPGQRRGVSWISPVFTRLVDWDEFEDADLMRQKVAACFGAFYSGNIDSEDETELHEKLEPGMIEFLPPGVEVKFPSPPAAGGIRDSASVCHHAIASGMGIAYEEMTGDFERVSFSSARMAYIRMARNVRDWQQHVMIDMLCEPVFQWFLLARTLVRGGSGDRTDSLAVHWTCPSREMIDPEKETHANMRRVRSGFAPWSEVVRETGRDPNQVIEQIAADQKRFDELGIVLDVDARKVSNQGQGSVNQKQEGTSDADAKS